MKSVVIIVTFFVAGMWIIYAMTFDTPPSIENWTLEDELRVEHLPLCKDGKVPDGGNWLEMDPIDWPCRVDIALTTQ